jgi:hypothetical protein
MRKPTLVVALTLAAATFVAGRQQPGDVPILFAGAVRQIEPPAGPDGWVVQVISRGGLGRRATGDRAISSAGGLTLFDPGTTATVRPDRLSLLGQYVKTSTPAKWTAGSSLSVCSDCVTTLMVLSRRDATGALQIYTTYWDPTTKATVPADVLRIYDLVSSVK